MFSDEKKCRKNGNTEFANFEFRVVKEEEEVVVEAFDLDINTQNTKDNNFRIPKQLLFYLCIS